MEPNGSSTREREREAGISPFVCTHHNRLVAGTVGKWMHTGEGDSWSFVGCSDSLKEQHDEN